MKNWLLVILKRGNVGIYMKRVDISSQSIHQSLVGVARCFDHLISRSFRYSCQWFCGSFALEPKSTHSSDDNRHVVNKGEFFLAFVVFQVRVYSHDTERVFALVQHIYDFLLVNVLFSGLKLGFNQLQSLFCVEDLERTEFGEVGVAHEGTDQIELVNDGCHGRKG